MSSHAMWKMIHLLHVYGPTITRSALRKAWRHDSSNRKSCLEPHQGASLNRLPIGRCHRSQPERLFELGFAQALGKDSLLFKQAGSTLPADLAGAHYYDYALDKLESGAKLLTRELKRLVKSNHVEQVKALAK